jgi:hypothetical protein
MRTYKAARILLNRHHSVLDCTVRNLSPGGACLSVPTTVGIPERFDMVIDADHMVRACRMVWHKERQFGVEFASEARPLAAAAGI